MSKLEATILQRDRATLYMPIEILSMVHNCMKNRIWKDLQVYIDCGLSMQTHVQRAVRGRNLADLITEANGLYNSHTPVRP